MKYTVDQIRDAARGACFYVTPGGMWLRMQYTDVDGFCASDEDSGEDYMFSFDELVEDGEDPEGQQSAPHADEQHCQSECSVVHE